MYFKILSLFRWLPFIFFSSFMSAQTDPFEVRIDSGFITDHLDQSQLVHNSLLTVTNSLSAAQSFKAGITGELFKVSLLMGASTPGNFVLQVSQGASPGGAVMSTSLFQVASFDTYSIELTTPFPVDSGEALTLIVSVQGGTSYTGDWYKQNTNIYSNGSAFIGTGSYTPLLNDDMVFTTYVRNPDSVSVTRLRITDEGYVGTKEYLFPAQQGEEGQVLMSDGLDSVNWKFQKIKILEDYNGDTKIEVEKNPDDDIIRFTLEGNEMISLRRNNNGDPRLEFYNAGQPFVSNLFIGRDAGAVNTEVGNTGVGVDALRFNTSGFSNTAIGAWALANNSTGSFNTGVGAGIFGSNTSGTLNSGFGAGVLNYNSTGSGNTAVGYGTMYSNTTGHNSTAFGSSTLYYNTTGRANTAVGTYALFRNTTRSNLVAVGDSSLYNNGLGASSSNQAIGNTAVGSKSLFGNTLGSNNSAVGFRSLFSNTTGKSNTAIGSKALYTNTAYSNLVAVGDSALYFNGTGATQSTFHAAKNTAIGSKALYSNTWGYVNTATGYEALRSNTSGAGNVANGASSLVNNTTGNFNTAVGIRSLSANTSDFNTAMGAESLLQNTSGGSNAGLGIQTLYNNLTGSCNTAIGSSVLFNNTNANYNTGLGCGALYNNLTGYANIGIGAFPLYMNNGNYNIAIGKLSLYSNTNRSNLIAIGDSTLYMNGVGATLFYHGTCNTAVGSKSMASNTIGYDNTSCGFEVLLVNSTGYGNTAVGSKSMSGNTTGYDNTTCGFKTLNTNTTGKSNTAMGREALYLNTTGDNNTAIGYRALASNTTGFTNSAFGLLSLENNTTGYFNVGIGSSSLGANTIGRYNTAIGSGSLLQNTTASENVAIGFNALYEMSYSNGGSEYAPGCVAIGKDALRNNNPTGLINNGNWNVAVGRQSLYENTIGAANVAVGGAAGNTNTNGDFNVFVGHDADCNAGTYDNGMALGYFSTVTASNQVRIGNATMMSIGGFQAWSNLSDARFKNNIRENVPGLGFILRLRPVTYHLDIRAVNSFLGIEETEESMPIPQAALDQLRSGFLAQEVEEAAIASGFDFDGIDKPKNNQDMYGLRYAEFTVPLVKAVQEQQAHIELLDARIQELENINKLLESKLADVEVMKTEIQLIKKQIHPK